ncbi:MAG: hypothetical protein ACLTDR_07345 [Adlercreutzia equolifaciens]
MANSFSGARTWPRSASSYPAGSAPGPGQPARLNPRPSPSRIPLCGRSCAARAGARYLLNRFYHPSSNHNFLRTRAELTIVPHRISRANENVTSENPDMRPMGGFALEAHVLVTSRETS